LAPLAQTRSAVPIDAKAISAIPRAAKYPNRCGSARPHAKLREASPLERIE
jgi:hypothetical protein